MNTMQNIVIVGGGFAGTAAIKHLKGRLPEGHRLIVISEESYTTFSPMLPEAVGASIFPVQVVAPIREILGPNASNQFIMGRVLSVDTTAKILTCETLAGDTEIPYAHLILTCGNRAHLSLLPGMEEHALPLKTVGDAMLIRNMVLRRLARIELEDDPEVRCRYGHFAIIGGGFSGVEVAGELVDCLKSILRYFPRVRRDDIKVSIIHNADRLLLELPAALGKAAQCSLEKRGVRIRLGVRASEISAKGVHFDDGELLTSATVISTIGTRPNSLIENLGLPMERGRVISRPDLSVRGHPAIWVGGDCALIFNAYNQEYAPPTAQFAVREGKLLATNILATLAGHATESFHYRPRGAMAAIGHMKGVAQIFGISVSGLPAWLAWRAYYLSQMPTLGRKVRIFVEWTWGMFFSVDITHLRFTRSHDVENDTIDTHH